jgi:septal ring factor EnvC (AmiA/AmiB activator)
MNITCSQCGKDFVFTKAEQEFYEKRGFILPRRCKECRPAKQSEPHNIVCSQCGTEQRKAMPIYCATCLANVQLEFEMKTKQMQKAINEAYANLKAAQSKNAELEKSLCYKEKLTGELGQKVNNLSQDLEELHQLRAALNQWFQPTLNGVEQRVTQRLEALVSGQDKTNEKILQLVQRMYEMYENITLWELVKRNLRHFQGQSTQPT